MIAERIARGLGLQASVSDVASGTPSAYNVSPISLRGIVPLVPSMGVQRWATFRTIYLTNPWVYAAVNKKARDIARLPLNVYSIDVDGDPTRVRGDGAMTPGRPTGGQSLDRLLSSQGFGGISKNAAVTATLTERFVYGNSLWEIIRPYGGGMPNALKRIRWRDVLMVGESIDNEVIYYDILPRNDYGMSGQQRRVYPSDVVHFGLGSDSDSAIGISFLQACRHTLTLHDALIRHLIGYFTNSARPSGHIKVDKLDRKTAELIRDLIQEWYSSPENAGRVLTTSGEWQSMSDTPDQSQIIELMTASAVEVAAAANIPPPVLGILDKAIKSNVHELREQYVREGLGPDASDFEEDIKAQLLTQVPSWAGLDLCLDLDEQLRPDLEARALVYQKMAGYYTVDDVRSMENLKPLRIKGVTDVPWAASGYQPMSAWEGGKSPHPAPGGGAPSAELIQEALVLWHAEEASANGNGAHHDEETVDV